MMFLRCFLVQYLASSTVLAGSLTLDADDIQLREGEDVNAAVERVMQKIMTDSEQNRHKKLHARVQQQKAADRYKDPLSPEESEYFVNYEATGVHRDMILDRHRTGQYKLAIEAAVAARRREQGLAALVSSTTDVELEDSTNKKAKDATVTEMPDVPMRKTTSTESSSEDQMEEEEDGSEDEDTMSSEDASTAIVNGPIVVDFGCGTGILSIFAARAGAGRVYCVEKSRMRAKAKRVIRKNGLADRIKVVSSMEKVPAGVADILVSEFMGFMILAEDMLGDFLTARDRVLKDEGTLIPSRGAVWAQPAADPVWWQQNVNWPANNEYGIDFSPVVEDRRNDTSPARFGHFGIFQNQKLLGERKAICDLDFESDKYDEDWQCGHSSKRPHRWQEIADNWHGFLISWYVHLYDDIYLSTHPQGGVSDDYSVDDSRGDATQKMSASGRAKASPSKKGVSAESAAWSHWGHLFWPRPLDSHVGSGSVAHKLELGAFLTRAKVYKHDFTLRYRYAGESGVGERVLREPELTADLLSMEDATQTKRLYTAMLASKQKQAQHERHKQKRHTKGTSKNRKTTSSTSKNENSRSNKRSGGTTATGEL
ncbi:unnamed protein product [Amoebophrya sp. A25]|nr:unnamed protein product [Amoebophrya sp. A25]|eukprot:GSA25T00021571001.1